MKTLLYLFLLSVALISVNSAGSDTDNPYLVKGKCKGMWRPERLVGRCFGLKEHFRFPQLKDITTVNNAVECKSLCCNLGAECITWQYESAEKVCKLGEKVRLGFEHADTPNWCEPQAPSKWNGRKIVSREGGKCIWREDNLDNQCFGLGPERFNSTKGRLDTAGCEKACCDDGECKTWQEMPGRGCYYTADKGVHSGTCDGVKNAVYDGARKCIPGYCGGMEHSMLKNHSSVQAKREEHRLRHI